MSAHPETHNRKALAIMLLVITFLQLVLAAHHPSVSASHAPQETLAAIAQFAQLDRFIHGGLILMYGALLLGFHAFDGMLSDRGWIQRFAFPVYVAGYFCLVIAALIDGFVIAEFATTFAQASDATIATAMVALAVLAICIQIFTKFGLLLCAAAMVLWGLSLLRQGRRLYVPAALALFAALAPFFLILTGGHITAHGVVVFVLLQSIWTLTVAYLLWGHLSFGKVAA